MTFEQSQQLRELACRLAAVSGATRAVESCLRPHRDEEDVEYLKTTLASCHRQLDAITSEIDRLNCQLRQESRDREVRQAPLHPLAVAEAVTDYEPEAIDLSCPNPEAN